MKIKITNIKITLTGKTIELTLDEAKELQKALNETFPEKEIRYIPTQPIIIERNVPIWPWRPASPMWEVTCESRSNTLCLSSGSIQG